MRTTVRTSRCIVFGCLLLVASGCTFGPEEEQSAIAQVVHLEGSYEALVVVRHDRFREPTGLSAFPDGGKRRYIEREALLYRLDAMNRTTRVVFIYGAPDSLWESFSMWIHGIDGDSVAFLDLTGCPKGGECYPPLWKDLNFRVSRSGEAQFVQEMPKGIGLPGVMLARRPGEERYVRLSSNGSVISGRFDDGGPFETLFRVREDGSIEPEAGKREDGR